MSYGCLVDHGGACEVLFHAADKDLRVQRLDLLQASKSQAVDGVRAVKAAGAGGSVLFAGQDELLVLRYGPLSSSGSADGAAATGGWGILATDAYSLECEGSGGRRSKGKGRHLRQVHPLLPIQAMRSLPLKERMPASGLQVEAVSCSADGLHAVVLCR